MDFGVYRWYVNLFRISQSGWGHSITEGCQIGHAGFLGKEFPNVYVTLFLGGVENFDARQLMDFHWICGDGEMSKMFYININELFFFHL